MCFQRYKACRDSAELNIGDRLNTVSESMDSNTELSEFLLVLTEFQAESSVSSSQPLICVPK